MGWRIIIQSDRNPEYLEARAEAFLVDLERRLESMTDEDFASQRTGLIALKLEKYKNLGEEMSTFWNHIQSGYHDFTRRKIHYMPRGTLQLTPNGRHERRKHVKRNIQARCY
jgi:insulysin